MFGQNLDDLTSAGVTVRYFCGIPLDDDGNICPQEAVGEITLPVEGMPDVTLPVCEGHLKFIGENFSVES